jgi:hypothetical protein
MDVRKGDKRAVYFVIFVFSQKFLLLNM